MYENWMKTPDCFKKNKNIDSNLIYGTDVENVFISIMIPTYKRASTLKDTIESALQQNLKIPYEIAVMDNDDTINAETDSLMEELCRHNKNLKYYRNSENLGMFGNLNRCIELAQGKWIVILHDDDMLKENYLEKVVPVLEKKEYGIFGVFPEFMEDVNGKLIETDKCLKANKIKKIISKATRGKVKQLKVKDFRRNISINATGYILNKEKAMSSGGFNQDYYPLDFSFYDKMGMIYECGIITDMLTVRRIGENEAKKVETIIGCAKGMREFSIAMGKTIGINRKWSSDFAAASFINNSYDKYNNEIDIKQIYSAANLSQIWQYIPKSCMKILLMFYWLEIILRF